MVSARRLFLESAEISLFAAGDESFGDSFQFFPARANGLRFFLADLIVGRCHGDDLQQVGEFLDDFVRRGNEK